jgi:hypothetical protein
MVRNADGICNVKIVSGTRTPHIESAYARVINRIARVMQRSACKTCGRFSAREGRIRSVFSVRDLQFYATIFRPPICLLLWLRGDRQRFALPRTVFDLRDLPQCTLRLRPGWIRRLDRSGDQASRDERRKDCEVGFSAVFHGDLSMI